LSGGAVPEKPPGKSAELANLRVSGKKQKGKIQISVPTLQVYQANYCKCTKPITAGIPSQLLQVYQANYCRYTKPITAGISS